MRTARFAPSLLAALIVGLVPALRPTPLVASSPAPESEVRSLAPAGWQVEGNAVGVRYGNSATTVGDVNGDGFSDVVVTAEGTVSGTGTAYLYLGGSGGLATTAVWSRTNFTLAPKAAPAGDVNGDGYDDFMIGFAQYPVNGGGLVVVYYGHQNGIPTGPFTRSANFGSVGYSFGTAGDVNGDGFDDIVIGGPNVDCNGQGAGIFEIYYGSDLGLSLANGTTYCPSLGPGDHFGYAVGAAGDVNGDGYGDVVVGAPDHNIISGPLAPAGGYVAVYMGGPGGLGSSFQVPPIRMSHLQVGCRYGAAVSTAGDVNGDGYSDIVVGAPNLGSGGVLEHGDVLIYGGTTATGSLPLLWASLGLYQNEHLGMQVAPAGDVNGDGYADVAVSAPNEPWVAGSNQGVVYVVMGRETMSQALLATIHGAAASETFGAALGTAGDVNGDGFSELIVGGPGWSNGESNEGHAVLYSGAADPPQSAAMWTQNGAMSEQLGYSIAPAGDVNGDGYGDVIVGSILWDGGDFSYPGAARVYYGGSTGLSSSSTLLPGTIPFAVFGYSVAGAGDFNGDGYEDVIVGEPGGLARAYPGGIFGVSTTPIWTVSGGPSSGFGFCVAGAGDVNGDGISDVLVGAPYDGSFAGRAYLYLGGLGTPSTIPARVFDPGPNDGTLGECVAGVGDLNKDGFSDIIIASPSWHGTVPEAGRIQVYFGSLDGVEATPRQDVTSPVAMRFGAKVAGIGDVNGDGYSDVAIGCPLYSSSANHQGRVIGFFGSTGGLSGLAWDIVGAAEEDRLGLVVAGAGDVNDDGRSDLLAGSSMTGPTDAGQVSIYTTVGSNTPFRTWNGEVGSDWFGYSAAGAGDVNGDGFGDVVVGAPQSDAGAQDAGKAYQFLGNLPAGDDGLVRWLKLRRSDTTAPVPPGGRTDQSDRIHVSAFCRSAAGASRVTMEHRLKPTNGGPEVTGLTGPVQTLPGILGAANPIQVLATGLSPAKLYAAKVRVHSNSPYFPWSPWFSPVLGGREVMDFRTRSAVGVTAAGVPQPLQLSPPRPNPSRGNTSLTFSLPARARVTLAIHDVAGREVARLADGELEAGEHHRSWDGTNAKGQAVGAGIYFARLVTPDGGSVQKLVRMN